APAGFDRGATDHARSTEGGIEDAYPLTPVQAGMLFHTMADPEAGHYVEQFTCLLRGELDLPALRESMGRLIARHPALRSALHSGDHDQPYQVAHRRVEPGVDHNDWRGLPDAIQREKLTSLLASDRRKGFDPTSPPLSRLALVRLDEDRHLLLWSVHHV